MNPQIPNPAAPPGTDAPAPPGVRLPAWPSRYRPDRRGWLLLAGLLLLVLSHPRLWNPHSDGLYFAPLGVGLALIAWLGSFAAIFVAVVLLAVRLVTPDPSTPAVILWLEPLLSAGTLALGWWCYRRRAHGARQLDDPLGHRLPDPDPRCLRQPAGGGAGAAAPGTAPGPWTCRRWQRGCGCSATLGVLALAPPLLVAATPWLVRFGLAAADSDEKPYQTERLLRWRWDEAIEVAGLAVGAGVLGLVLAALHSRAANTNWALWGILLLVIVWASLRQGLRGGTLAAAAAAAPALIFAPALGNLDAVSPVWGDAQLAPLAGNLLAQCCTALLIGASAGWVRASETRYRQVVGHIPLVLYSARLLHPGRPATRPEDVEITLVSAASKDVLGAAADDLLGDYQGWLARVHSQDRELVLAAMGQLFLQKQPVTCEYRLATTASRPPLRPRGLLAMHQTPTNRDRWVRDTLAPHHGADGQLDGWDGVVEDITEHRTLAYDLRRTTNVLQAVVTHLPTGVFLIHGPTGQPLLVNARARQLLGQREDPSAGLCTCRTCTACSGPTARPTPGRSCRSARRCVTASPACATTSSSTAPMAGRCRSSPGPHRLIWRATAATTERSGCWKT